MGLLSEPHCCEQFDRYCGLRVVMAYKVLVFGLRVAVKTLPLLAGESAREQLPWRSEAFAVAAEHVASPEKVRAVRSLAHQLPLLSVPPSPRQGLHQLTMPSAT